MLAVWLLGRIIGGIGLLAFLWMLSAPAYDAGCDDESKRLITAFWALLILSPIVGVFPRPMSPVGFAWGAYGFMAVFIVLWTIAAGLAVWCMASLAVSASHEKRDLGRLGARSERIRATRAELDREVSSQIRRYPTE
jgi:hypothetical protein